MTVPLIIGYGNTLRADDGIGPRAALAAGARLPGAQVIVSHQLTPEMAEAVSRCDIAIFIDADAAAPAGEVCLKRVLPAGPERASFTHHVTPATLLRFAEALYGDAPEVYLLSAGAESLEFNETLTSAASAAVEKIVGMVCDLVRARDNSIS